MKVAIYSRAVDHDRPVAIKQLFEELTRHNIEPVVFQPFHEQLGSEFSLPQTPALFNVSDDLDDTIDFVISLGGDGTLLDTVTLVRNKNIPIVGINFGRLGFLASIGKEELAMAVSSLRHRTFIIDK